MIKDRIAFDLPVYDGLLAGHYQRGPGYGRRRPGGTDDWLLVMTLAGMGHFGDHVAAAPELTLIAPGTTHDYGIHRQAEEWEILWVHFQAETDWLELLQWTEVSPGLYELHPHNPEPIEEAFRQVLQISLQTGPLRRQFAMNALERLLLLCAAQRPSEGRSIDDRIRSTVNYIHADLRLPHTLESLSKQAALSPSRFAHLFKAEMGLSPRQYLLQQRILHARNLLERTSLSVTEVAHAVGMEPVAFSLRFKEELGHSPREHRKAMRS